MVEEKYRRLYPFEGTNHWVVLNEINGQLYVRKELQFYDIKVYEFIRTHKYRHLASVAEYYFSDKKLIVFEELIQGKTLENVIKYDQPSLSECRRIFMEICNGVRFLHEAEEPIVHRDLKLSNIIINNDGVVKVLDYNSSKEINRGTSRDTILLGTEGYAAPEQYGFGSSDEKTDIYALGIIGEKLFPNGEYDDIWKKAKQIDPQNRFGSVFEMQCHFCNMENAAIKEKKIHEPVKIKKPQLKNIWPPPGFRTKNLWKMLVAIFIDCIYVYSACTEHYMGEDIHIEVNAVFMIIGYIIGVDIVCDWTGLFSNLPGIHHKNILLRLVILYGYAIIVFGFLMGLAWFTDYFVYT